MSYSLIKGGITHRQTGNWIPLRRTVRGRHISGKAELKAGSCPMRDVRGVSSYRLLVSSATRPCRPVQSFIQVKKGEASHRTYRRFG
jgi:hypothetical protein